MFKPEIKLERVTDITLDILKKYNINSLKELYAFEEKSERPKATPKPNEASYDIEKYENFSLFD